MAYDKIINVKIDVSKIVKDWLFKGEKGNYLDATILYNDEKDGYENNGMIVQSVPKKVREEKGKEFRGPILGNVSTFISGGGSSAESKPGKESGQMGAASDDDDLPF